MKTSEEIKKDTRSAMDEFIDAFRWDCGSEISPAALEVIEKWLRDHAYNFATKATKAALGQGFTPDSEKIWKNITPEIAKAHGISVAEPD